jgi:broad specificity phosphatase PhoE
MADSARLGHAQLAPDARLSEHPRLATRPARFACLELQPQLVAALVNPNHQQSVEAGGRSGRLILIRHGETAWSRAGRYTGRTDLPLTEHGERQASALAPFLAGLRTELVLTSPLRRARRTAELAGFEAEIEPDLSEWDYGTLEGHTEQEIGGALGTPWSIWNASGGPSPGEALADITVRADRVLRRIEPQVKKGGDVLLFAHGHLLCILAVRWLGLPPQAAAAFALSPASASVLEDRCDSDRGLNTWNFTPWRCAKPRRPDVQ